jgi:hypothetical protein
MTGGEGFDTQKFHAGYRGFATRIVSSRTSFTGQLHTPFRGVLEKVGYIVYIVTGALVLFLFLYY